jgi:uncharacterized protein with ParB-like and HNH nuclease domain
MLHSADKTDLEKILTTYQLSVPDYQRPYRWSKSEAEEFWEDLYGYYEDHKSDPTTESNLYLGSFIFFTLLLVTETKGHYNLLSFSFL